MSKLFWRRIAVGALFMLCMAIAAAGGATGASMITGKQIKNGTVTMKDLSKDVRKRIARTGATGATGPKGDVGATGATGPALMRGTQNVETSFAITTTPKTVATINDDLSEGVYSGNYSGSLVHPAGLSGYMVVNVQANVASVSGTGVSCTLQKKQNSGSWITIVDTGTISASQYFMNSSFPSFTAGDHWAFRVQCRTTAGSGTARGEIGVVAGPVSG